MVRSEIRRGFCFFNAKYVKKIRRNLEIKMKYMGFVVWRMWEEFFDGVSDKVENKEFDNGFHIYEFLILSL
jgi:long-subunit acyl-CoA synthetase (AMP-forming)